MKLPDGWAAQTATEDHLEVGPAGRAVLRIDLTPGAGSQLPTADALGKSITQSLPGTQVKPVDSFEKDGVALVVVSVPAKNGDGGSEELFQLLGAKRIGDDLFLCASIPGAAEDEVKRAARACEDVEKP